MTSCRICHQRQPWKAARHKPVNEAVHIWRLCFHPDQLLTIIWFWFQFLKLKFNVPVSDKFSSASQWKPEDGRFTYGWHSWWLMAPNAVSFCLIVEWISRVFHSWVWVWTETLCYPSLPAGSDKQLSAELRPILLQVCFLYQKAAEE